MHCTVLLHSSHDGAAALNRAQTPSPRRRSLRARQYMRDAMGSPPMAFMLTQRKMVRWGGQGAASRERGPVVRM